MMAIAALLIGSTLIACTRAGYQSSGDGAHATSPSQNPATANASVSGQAAALHGTPSVSFERGEDPSIIAHASATVSLADAEPDDLRYIAAFVFVDESGKALRTALAKQKPITPDEVDEASQGETQSENRDADIVVPEAWLNLTPEEYDAISGMHFAFIRLDGAPTLILQDLPPYPIDDGKRAFAMANDERAWQEHVAQWRAKYPIDDFSDTLLIGDSIMQNANSSLQEALPGVTIDADSGRTLEYGGLIYESEGPDDGVLDHVRNDDGSHARYVIGTGSNDVGGMALEDAEEIVSCLGPEKEVYFVTMCVTGNPSGTATTNAAIDEVAERYPNVHKIDWHDYVDGREDDYLYDGCHPRKEREPEYAACLKNGLGVVY